MIIPDDLLKIDGEFLWTGPHGPCAHEGPHTHTEGGLIRLGYDVTVKREQRITRPHTTNRPRQLRANADGADQTQKGYPMSDQPKPVAEVKRDIDRLIRTVEVPATRKPFTVYGWSAEAA